MRTPVTFSGNKKAFPGYQVISRSLFILIFFGLSAYSAIGQQAATKGDFKVWAVPAEQKVRPKDKPETTNLVWFSH